MSDPIITYSAKIHSLDGYDDTESVFGGTCTNSNPLDMDVRIWNNRYGLEDVDDLTNFNVNFYFENYEDSSLLSFLDVEYDSNYKMNIEVFDNVATGTFIENRTISGAANYGATTNTDNYLDLEIKLDITDQDLNLKNQDIKSLYVEVVKK